MSVDPLDGRWCGHPACQGHHYGAFPAVAELRQISTGEHVVFLCNDCFRWYLGAYRDVEVVHLEAKWMQWL